jgi:hypothetical protein
MRLSGLCPETPIINNIRGADIFAEQNKKSYFPRYTFGERAFEN